MVEKRRVGILTPLFSLYSKNSIGLGDFADLKLLIDWAKDCGNSVIQLLPMNEVGPVFCPYDALSSFALEPMYITLPAPRIKALRKSFPTGKGYVNYAVKGARTKVLQEIFSKKEQKECAAEINNFKKENTYWLSDFALFKALKAHHKGSPWYEWEDKFKNRESHALADFKAGHTEEIEFEVWLQYLAFRQFKEVLAYAESKKVQLLGDLPILVSRDSADVWQHPGFFKLEYAAGAPPDMYCAKGQRWGMPTYNWQRIADNGYRYLKEKLHYAENFYDMLRIDHVVGLFRIWSIPYNEPLENQGLNGFFDPQDESKWEEQGRRILKVIVKSSKMQILAEDLGVIPKSCPKVIEELGIPGNDVQRWAKDWQMRHDFLEPDEYRLLSVAMLSTHDTTNWPAWWENEAGTVDEALIMRRCNERGIDYNRVRQKLFDLKKSRHGRLRWLEEIDSADKLVNILRGGQGQSPSGTVPAPVPDPKERFADFIDFYENSYHEKEKLWKHLGLKGQMKEKCDAAILRAALKITLDSRSLFCINTLIDLFFLGGLFKADAYPYRINTPGTVSEKNWSLALPLPLEQLMKHKVTKEIKALIAAS